MGERSGAMVTLTGAFDSPPSVQRRVAERVQAALERFHAQQASAGLPGAGVSSGSSLEAAPVAPPSKSR
jgi:hypothetical protein